jgi:hypothetical protein
MLDEGGLLSWFEGLWPSGAGGYGDGELGEEVLNTGG